MRRAIDATFVFEKRREKSRKENEKRDMYAVASAAGVWHHLHSNCLMFVKSLHKH
jgi:hypothetical protein